MLAGVNKADPKDRTPLNLGELEAHGDASSPCCHRPSGLLASSRGLWAITALTLLLAILAEMSGLQSLHHGCF